MNIKKLISELQSLSFEKFLADKFAKLYTDNDYLEIKTSDNKNYNFITEWKDKVRAFKFSEKIHAKSIFAYHFDKEKPYFYVGYDDSYYDEVQNFVCVSSDYKSFFELISSVGGEYDIKSFEFYLVDKKTNQIIHSDGISPMYMLEDDGIYDLYLYDILKGNIEKEYFEMYQNFIPKEQNKEVFTPKQEKELAKNMSIKINDDIFKNITYKKMIEMLLEKGYEPYSSKIRINQNTDQMRYSLDNEKKSFRITKILYDCAVKMQIK